jgi:hypothetical protein
MTPEELAAIKARAAGATLGPWVAVHRRSGHLRHEVGRPRRRLHVDSRWGSGPVIDPLVNCRSTDEEEAALNAEFIAHAREDVPLLVAEVERLRTLLDAVTAPETDPMATDQFPPYIWDGHAEDLVCQWCYAHKYEPKDEPHDADCPWAAARKALGQ